MLGYGQIVDDFPTPEGRFLAVWDFALTTSWSAIVPDDFPAEVGTLVSFEFEQDRVKGRMAVVQELPAHVRPLIEAPSLSPAALKAGCQDVARH